VEEVRWQLVPRSGRKVPMAEMLSFKPPCRALHCPACRCAGCSQLATWQGQRIRHAGTAAAGHVALPQR
jgi:hypothetical protein